MEISKTDSTRSSESDYSQNDFQTKYDHERKIQYDVEPNKINDFEIRQLHFHSKEYRKTLHLLNGFDPKKAIKILFVGEHSQGKSLMIDSFANHLLGVEQNHDFRYRNVVSGVYKHQDLKNDEVYNYYFRKYGQRSQHILLIDTPGFTEDPNQNERTMKLIKGACIKHVHIHAIAVVADAYDDNDSQAKQYMKTEFFESFAKDFENIYMLMTKYNHDRQTTVQNHFDWLNIRKTFKFNNKVLYDKRTDDIEDIAEKMWINMFWDTKRIAFNSFIQDLKNIDMTNSKYDFRERNSGYIPYMEERSKSYADIQSEIPIRRLIFHSGEASQLKLYFNLETKKTVNILFIGEKGCGKKILINAITNYMLGVEMDDNFRYIYEKQDSVYNYSLIDYGKGYRVNLIYTPNIDGELLGDTADQKQLFDVRNEILKHKQIDAICFCVKATTTDEDDKEDKNKSLFKKMYILDQLLGIFPKDVLPNLMICHLLCQNFNPESKKFIEKYQQSRNVKLNAKEFFFNNQYMYKDLKEDFEGEGRWYLLNSNIDKFLKYCSQEIQCLSSTHKLANNYMDLEIKAKEYVECENKDDRKAILDEVIQLRQYELKNCLVNSINSMHDYIVTKITKIQKDTSAEISVKSQTLNGLNLLLKQYDVMKNPKLVK